MRRWLALLGLVLTSSCASATGNVASPPRTEATPSEATPTRTPAGPPYAVVVDESPPTSYRIGVVASDGKEVAAYEAARRVIPADALDLPYVSTTSDALYFLDGYAVEKVVITGLQESPLKVYSPDGGTDMETVFAVSPDDTRVAVAVLDYRTRPVHVRLYVDSLQGGDRHVIFESDSDYVWPVAWHGGLLVLAHAYGPYVSEALKAAPGRDNPYWAISYHVVDPVSANRVVLMGSCTVSGPLSPAGSACIQGGAIDWQGTVSHPWSTRDWGSISAAASISPDGSLIAAADPDNPDRLDIWRPDGGIATWFEGSAQQEWAGWLDNTHIFIPATPKYPARFVMLSQGPSPAAFTAATGFYAARLPTDIV